MKKKYLTTIEEILALKDTDTKIYCESSPDWYCQFIDGVLCRIFTNNTAIVNASVDLANKYYIFAEEPTEEVTKKDIGCLCAFWDFHEDDKQVGVLVALDTDACPYHDGYTYYQHCRHLTPTEVAEITGYKVEE